MHPEFDRKSRISAIVTDAYSGSQQDVSLEGIAMNAISKNAQRAAATENDPRWAALVVRDARADGSFWYSVATTGVYCRPSCAARLPRPENVHFYRSRAEAEKAGFRPCKRCKPDRPPLIELHVAQVTAACRLIETSESAPSLETLAAHAGMSP